MKRNPKPQTSAAAGGPSATEAILESISDGVFTVDREWRIASFNRAAVEITGIPRSEAIGRPCAEVFRAGACENECALRKTLNTNAPIIGKPTFIVNADGRRIPISISTAVLRDKKGRIIGGAETFRDLSLVEELRKELEGRFEIGDIVSRSAAMRRLFEILPQVAASESNVLICGETGTGKELAARAIHSMSRRRKKPFVAVNCGALPDTLLESELFGYKAGAFTGAGRDKPGRFAMAEGGTLFLDEIGDISPALQVRLLRVLEEKTYEMLGGTQTMRADTRIVAATNRDLPGLIKKGAFREDLFYRLNVVRLELPPLRKRKEDIPILVERFVGRFNRLQGKSVSGVSPEVMSLLMEHDYPGNVRELENLVEHAFVLCKGERIEIGDMPAEFMGRFSRPPPAGGMKSTMREMSARAITEALQRHGYNRLAAARELGIHKSTLFRKIKSLGLAPPRKSGRRGRD